MQVGGLTIFALWAGRFLGFELIESYVGAGSALGFEGPAVIVSFLVLLAGLLLTGRNNLLEAWGMRSPGELQIEALALERACTEIASQRSLSKREGEILRSMVDGKTRNEIADDLVLSRETVKTHMRHLYAKCSVASRQELLAMVREQAKASGERVLDDLGLLSLPDRKS